MQARLDGADGNLENGRHFGERHVFLKVKNQDSTTRWRQDGSVEQRTQALIRWSGHWRNEGLQHFLGGFFPPAPSLSAYVSESRTARNTVGPGAKQQRIVEPTQFSGDGNQDVLQDIIGRRWTNQPEDVAAQRWLHAA